MNGCKGGLPIIANEWIYNNNITDETCNSYIAKGWVNWTEDGILINFFFKYRMNIIFNITKYI